MVLTKHHPKLWLLPLKNNEKCDIDQEDAGVIAVFTDRIPSVLIVRWFDMFCFGFAMCSYILDFFTDIGVSIFHFYAGRYVSGSLVLIFAIVPSLIINVISMIWMLDDEMHWKRRAHPRRTGTVELDQKRFISTTKMGILCVLQLGPLFWYYKALYYGNMFRNSTEKTDKEKRRFFMKMVEAERDATWLRFYEAFLESAPQMIIQGSIATKYFSEHFNDARIPIWLYFQALSLFLSMISISWSVVVQNRSLRMIRDDKVNIWPHEAILQFCWRFLTILSRMITLSSAVIIFGSYMILLTTGHLIITLVHVTFLQAVHIENCTTVEKLLLVVNTVIHIFTPFNMAEGQTKYRYLAAYSIEFVEMMVIFAVLPLLGIKVFDDQSYFRLMQIGVPAIFFLGITIMIVYYTCFHPNRRQFIVSQSQMDLSEGCEKTDKLPATVTVKVEDVIEISDEITALKPVDVAAENVVILTNDNSKIESGEPLLEENN